MTPEEVLKVVEGIVKLEKEHTSGVNKPKDGIIPYSESYVRGVRQRNKIRVHADPDHFPEKLFAHRSPNETKEQHDYVKANYECTTNPVFQDYLSVTGRAFIGSNWTVIYGEGKDEEDFKKYVTEDLPIYKSVEAFETGVMPPIKAEDANGVIAIRPFGFQMIKRGDDVVLDDQQQFEPTIYYHPIEKVLINNHEFILVVDDEKSSVEFNLKTVKQGRILYVYDKEHITKIIQVGKKVDNLYAIEFQFKHGDSVIPATTLKGVPVINKNGKIYWISPFYYAVSSLNLALANRNILQTSINSCVFPFRVMKATDCDFIDTENRCYNGKLTSLSGGHQTGSCSKCNGTGDMIPISPTGVYLWQDTDEGKSSAPHVDYKAPDSESLIFVREQIQIDTDNGRNILHLQTSNSNVKGTEEQTATGKALDQKAQFAFIRGVSDQYFDLYEWMLNRIAWQRYDTLDVAPTVVRAQHFDFRTEVEIWEEIKTARDADAPPSIVNRLFMRLLNNMLSSDPDAQKSFEAILTADKLFSLSTQDVALRKASNTIDPFELTLHHSATQLVKDLMLIDPKWLDKELDEKVKDLITLAKKTTFTPTNSLVDEITDNG